MSTLDTIMPGFTPAAGSRRGGGAPNSQEAGQDVFAGLLGGLAPVQADQPSVNRKGDGAFSTMPGLLTSKAVETAGEPTAKPDSAPFPTMSIADETAPPLDPTVQADGEVPASDEPAPARLATSSTTTTSAGTPVMTQAPLPGAMAQGASLTSAAGTMTEAVAAVSKASASSQAAAPETNGEARNTAPLAGREAAPTTGSTTETPFGPPAAAPDAGPAQTQGQAQVQPQEVQPQPQGQTQTSASSQDSTGAPAAPGQTFPSATAAPMDAHPLEQTRGEAPIPPSIDTDGEPDGAEVRPASTASSATNSADADSPAPQAAPVRMETAVNQAGQVVQAIQRRLDGSGRQARMDRADAEPSIASGLFADEPGADGVRSGPAPTPTASSQPALTLAAGGPTIQPRPEPAAAAPQPDITPPEGEAGEAARTIDAETAPTPQRDGLPSSLSRATIETTAMMAAQIVRRLEMRSTRFEMALTPEGLGRVDVSMEIDGDGQLAARLAFDNPAAAAELRGRVDELRRQLENAGFQLGENALQFADREGGRGGGRHNLFERQAGKAFAGADSLADSAVPATPPRWMSLNLTPEGVDMKV